MKPLIFCVLLATVAHGKTLLFELSDEIAKPERAELLLLAFDAFQRAAQEDNSGGVVGVTASFASRMPALTVHLSDADDLTRVEEMLTASYLAALAARQTERTDFLKKRLSTVKGELDNEKNDDRKELLRHLLLQLVPPHESGERKTLFRWRSID